MDGCTDEEGLSVTAEMIETTASCLHCAELARVTTPGGRMCGGHAMVESTRRWNLGDWSWSATPDEGEGDDRALTRLLDSAWAAQRLPQVGG